MFPDTPLVLAAPCDIHRTFRTRARESCEVVTAAPFTSKLYLAHLGCCFCHKAIFSVV